MTEGNPNRPVIRAARREDAGTILRLVRELAIYEDMLDHVQMQEADVLRDGFGDTPRFECLLAELDGDAVGFALFYHNYSTFKGRAGVYLEDIYVHERARGLGIGRTLMESVARLVLERQCSRFEFSVLHWNPTREFYHHLGFQHNADWLPYRLEGAALKRLAGVEES